MKVIFFHRKNIKGNFSIEALFQQIRENLPGDIASRVVEMNWQSKGIVRRLFCGMQTLFSQGEINHITGDIHFVSLFLPGRNTILTLHDIGFLENRKGLSAYLLKWFWVQWPVRHCAVITTISETSKNEIVKYVPEAGSKIQVIYNPISDLFIASPHKFNPTNPIILLIGTKPNKNIERQLQAVSEIPCVLYILGKLTPHQRQLIDRYQIKFKVFTNLSTEEVAGLYKECDIVSFVSTLEGFGLPIVEANAVGRVVVTGNVSSMPEVAGGSAHLVNPFEVDSIRAGIRKVMEDGAYRDQLIAKGYENARRFNARLLAGEYASLYRKIKDRNNPPHTS
ncbi:MAG: glycosyltransferase family 4 protein [Bacteroidetes bacterium]|nr:glycosyltransferase family 4 protein [Bacteroidota bacterium]